VQRRGVQANPSRPFSGPSSLRPSFLGWLPSLYLPFSCQLSTSALYRLNITWLTLSRINKTTSLKAKVGLGLIFTVIASILMTAALVAIWSNEAFQSCRPSHDEQGLDSMSQAVLMSNLDWEPMMAETKSSSGKILLRLTGPNIDRCLAIHSTVDQLNLPYQGELSLSKTCESFTDLLQNGSSTCRRVSQCLKYAMSSSFDSRNGLPGGGEGMPGLDDPL
jgi:hypothetical protein